MTRASVCLLLLSAGVVSAADPVKAIKLPPPPPDTIPKLDEPPTGPSTLVPVQVAKGTAKVELVPAAVKGEEAWAKALAEAKETYAKTRDYSGYMVRQERIGGRCRRTFGKPVRSRLADHRGTRARRPRPGRRPDPRG